jgi:protein-tyrosine phosphatase
MNWITEQIAIGNYLDAQDVELLRREGIGSILSLDGTLAGRVPAELGLRKIAVVKLQDGPGNAPDMFFRAVDTLSRLVSTSPPVMVQCHAGRSRSAVIVAGHFVKTRGILPDEALRLVAAKRELQVMPGLDSMLWHLS